MSPNKSSKRMGTATAALFAAAIATSGMAAFAPSMALAVPAGGYGDLVEAVSPSVVFIEVTTQATPAAVDAETADKMQRGFGGAVPKPSRALGSGFIISPQGDIITNSHVVTGASEVKVKLSDGRSFVATVVGNDPMTDLALLRIDAGELLPAVTFGETDKIRVGDEAIAVGNPFGLGGTVTTGIISAKSRNINAGPFDNFLQTDAAINRGNSGGPLFNADGQVIGVNTAIFSPDGGSVGIGFAVPADIVQKIAADLADDGVIDRGWLGVQIKPMSDEIASILGYDAPKGAIVQSVQPNSPAASAGFEAGDIILSFAGSPIAELRDLPRVVANASPETLQQVVVLRKGAEVTLAVTLGHLPPQDA